MDYENRLDVNLEGMEEYQRQMLCKEMEEQCAKENIDMLTWYRLGTDITLQDVWKNGELMETSGWCSGFFCYCWYNCLTLWKQTTDEVQAYYGIAEGKPNGYKPSPHMWLSVDGGKSAIETTDPHRNYVGVCLTEEQAETIINELKEAPHGRRLFTDCFRLYKQRGIIRDSKKKTTKRLITKRSNQKRTLFHPVMAKEIRKEHGLKIAKNNVWTSL